MIEALVTNKLSSAATTGNLIFDTILLVIIMYTMNLVFSQTEPLKAYISAKIKSYFTKKIVIKQPYEIKITKTAIITDSNTYELLQDKSNNVLITAIKYAVEKFNIINKKSEVNLLINDTNKYDDRHSYLSRKISYESNNETLLPNGIKVCFTTQFDNETDSKTQKNNIKITSITLIHEDVSIIRNFIEESYKNYIDNYYPPVEIKEKKRYYYGMTGDEKIPFNRFILNNSKSWNNLFIPNKNQLIDIVNRFNKNQLKLNKLVFLLYGPPGTGKTSFIKTIANETKRNIVNIKLSLIKNDQKLMSYIFNEQIDNNIGTDCVDIKNRIYLLEDIDAESDIVISRKDKEIEEKNKIKIEQEFFKNKNDETLIDAITDYNKKSKYCYYNELTLSGLLNCLDGVIELYGGIVIMTTNHPEKLDDALIRDGRVNIKMMLNNMHKEQIMEMLKYYYPDDDIDMDKFNMIPDLKHSPAKIEGICNINFTKNANYIIDEILKLN